MQLKRIIYLQEIQQEKVIKEEKENTYKPI